MADSRRAWQSLCIIVQQYFLLTRPSHPLPERKELKFTVKRIFRPALNTGLALLVAFFAQQSIAENNASAPETLTEGVLTIGSDLTYPPYYSTDNSQPVGFGPKMVQALAKQMDLEPRFENTKFAQLIVQLKAHRFDMVASALYITPERARQVDYVPLFQTGNSVITRQADSLQVAGATDLCGHRVSVIQGASVIAKLSADARQRCPNGQSVDIAEYPTAPEATQALLSHAVDAQIADAAVSQQIVDKTGGRLQISSDDILYPVPVGLAVPKGNHELQSALQDALAQLKKNGTYAKLLAEYNLRAPNPKRLPQALGES